MNVTCELCAGEVADLARVCSRCVSPLILDLRDAPGLDAELDIAVSRQAKMTAGNAGGGRSSEKPLPLNLTADDHGRHLKATLTTWAHLVADTRGLPRPLDGIPTTARWMLGHVEWLRHHPAGADAVTEIRESIANVRRAIDRPRVKVYAGQCDACGSALYASETASWAVCPVCLDDDGRTSYSVQERRDAMLSAMEVMCMGPTEAAYALSILVRPIPAATIRKWASRGKLEPAGVDDRGHSVYRLHDIAKLMMPAQQAG